MIRTALALVLLAGCAEDRVKTITDLTGDATAGADVFAANCASCHAADGTGGTGPDLTAEAEDPAEIAEYVLYGEDEMPAFDGDLTDQEIADVVAYVASIGGEGGDED